MLANVLDYRAVAQRFLPRFAYSYLEGGAEDEITMRRNREAFSRVMFSPQVLVDVTTINTATTVADRKVAWRPRRRESHAGRRPA